MPARITKITLHGFKSFGKRVSIPFLPGFNVITGPNGAGKSNIIEAVSFVLGITSAKHLRASRLSELIFNGGKKGKPAKYAKVTLWLDNSDKVFSTEDGEISISRKVNRKGVSVYKLNGKTVTRSQILEVLSNARIHPDGHNIVRQGDVTRVIEMNPIERRRIIDEIAGIAEYDEKKERAKKNLEEVEQKLREIEIILSERFETLKRLEIERNVAIKYRDLTKKVEILEASLAHQYMKLGLSKFQQLDVKIKEIEGEIERITEEVEQIDKRIGEVETQVKEKSEEMLEKSGVSDVVREMEEVRVKILRNKDKVESNRREIERIENMIEKLKAIRRSRLGYDKGVQAVLKLNKRGVYGTIADVISVPKEYKTAIEVAAGRHLQDIVVENDSIAIQLIEYLKREKLGRATFLPLNKIKRRELKKERRLLLSRPGVIGLASDLIDYDPKFSDAISFVLGSTVVVDSIRTAKEVGIGKVRMVTLDGDLVEESGAMVGGYYATSGVLDSTEQEIKEYEQAKQELMEEINFLEVEREQLEKKLKELEALAEEEAKEMVDLKKEREALEEELNELRAKREELLRKKMELENEANQLKIQRARVEAETEKYKMEVERFGKVEYVEEDPGLLEKRIREIKSELNRLGLVNMKAIEEYEKFKAEFDELKKKYDKIVEEKRAIIDMIERIETRKKEVFFGCMNKVSFFFNEMFKQLTGGSAHLELEDPNDLESGLIIRASPHGKKLLNIDAMSGGEKVLTALAFLFAIQRYKPAPFYLLDEVDAALDKVNSAKVAKLIKELSKKAQFIVITHNDATIKEADRVYGVTMRNGESKILGLELPEGG